MKERLDKQYPIEEVLSKVQMVNKTTGKYQKIDFDGHLINMASDRYKCFVLNGIQCKCCGLQADYFYMERWSEKDRDVPYHFNLYGNLDGKEILFTKDHIIPKSKGGANHITNYQTMCCICNEKKANKQMEKQ